MLSPLAFMSVFTAIGKGIQLCFWKGEDYLSILYILKQNSGEQSCILSYCAIGKLRGDRIRLVFFWFIDGLQFIYSKIRPMA